MLDATSTLAKPLVLVVEDEAALATMLRYNLEKQGFRVEEAGDGQEALTRIAEAQPDLVLLDWMLPVMSGIEVWRSDESVDEIYNALFRELITYMMEDPRNITPCTHLLFIAKNLERIGDHATNVAETVYYAVTGTPLTGTRPKGDSSAYAVVRPPRA